MPQRCTVVVLFCDFRFLFQESEEAKKLREERLAQYESKKSKSMSTKNFLISYACINFHVFEQDG